MKYHYTKGFEYFLHDPERGMLFFDTAQARDEYADKTIKEWLDEDGWHEDVTGILAGKVTHRAKETDRVDRPAGEDIDEEDCDGEGEYWPKDVEYKCNYRLMPVDDAAPDLLQVLKDIEAMLNAGIDASIVMDENSPARDAMRDAITKAEGGTV